MPRTRLGMNVFEAAVARIEQLYTDGHRVVVSFSGGKDSLCVLECAILAARRTSRLPVEAVMRDEELGWPGHYEYVERVAARPEVDLTWIVAREPHSYCLDREQPFWWSFDPRVEPERWVRQFPAYAIEIEEITIEAINSPARYPAPPDRDVACLIAIRASESRNRNFGVHSMGGHMGKVDADRHRGVWPLYDWNDKDVWTAIKRGGTSGVSWDYPDAYDRLFNAGLPRSSQRMGAFLNRWGVRSVPIMARILPWFAERLYARFPGLEDHVRDGLRALEPERRQGESWEQCFDRTCVTEAPAWIAPRADKVRSQALAAHARHDGGFFLDEMRCPQCGPGRQSWRDLTLGMYLGDPFSESAASGLPYVQPEVFRPELVGTPAGRWGGHPG